MKKLLLTFMSMLLLMIAARGIPVCAAAGNLLSEDSPMVSVVKNGESAGADVAIQIPEEEKGKIKTFGLKFNISGDVKDASFAFDASILDNQEITVHEYLYENGVLSVYVSGTESVFQGSDGAAPLGAIKVVPGTEAQSPIQVVVTEYQIVNEYGVKDIEEIESDGSRNPVVLTGTSQPSGSEPTESAPSNPAPSNPTPSGQAPSGQESKPSETASSGAGPSKPQASDSPESSSDAAASVPSSGAAGSGSSAAPSVPQSSEEESSQAPRPGSSTNASKPSASASSVQGSAGSESEDTAHESTVPDDTDTDTSSTAFSTEEPDGSEEAETMEHMDLPDLDETNTNPVLYGVIALLALLVIGGVAAAIVFLRKKK